MNFEQYKSAFAKKASDSGYSEENIQKCLQYAEPLIKANLPVIYNTSHLSSLVGYKKEYIKQAVVYTPYFYRDFSIYKKNGKKREISEPLPSLKDIQIWILQNILINVKISPFAKAYRKKVTLIENVRFLKNQDKILTADLEGFFPSVKIESIETIFKNLGYSKLISNLLSKLCTKDDSLPQGAPTSPTLSNIFFKSIDDEIVTYCMENNIRYTRYADDLSFSGNFDDKRLLEVVQNSIAKKNLQLNDSKTKIMTPNMQQSVTGIVVNEKPQVPFKKRNKIRQEIFYIKKFGLSNHKAHLKITQKNYLPHLLGKINFILQINPKDTEFIDYKKYLLELRKTEKD